MMKVLIINQHFEDVIGGSELQCDIIAKNLKKMGDEIIYGIVRPRKQKYNSEYKWIKINKPFALSFSRILKEYQPDVVYWRYNKKFLFIATIISKYYKVKFVFATSSINDTRWFIWNKFNNYDSFFKKIKIIVYNLYSNIKSLWNHIGFYFIDGVVNLNSSLCNKLPAKKEIVIHNSMIDTIKPFKWENPYIVWVANIKRIKNPELFIELAKHFEDRNIDFLMIGKIQDSSYNFLYKKEKLPTNFFYLGPKTLTEVNGIVKDSLFLVHTCEPEGFGNIFIQAWLHGKPTVSLYFDPENLITTHNIGFYSKNFRQLIEDVNILISDNFLRENMGIRARELATKKFNSYKNVKKLEEFLTKIIGDNKK